jgi:hypothetical protein
MITKNYDDDEQARSPIVTFNKDKTEITFDTKYISIDSEGFLCIDMTKLPYGLKIKRMRIEEITKVVAKKKKIEMIKVDNDLAEKNGDENNE